MIIINVKTYAILLTIIIKNNKQLSFLLNVWLSSTVFKSLYKYLNKNTRYHYVFFYGLVLARLDYSFCMCENFGCFYSKTEFFNKLILELKTKQKNIWSDTIHLFYWFFMQLKYYILLCTVLLFLETAHFKLLEQNLSHTIKLLLFLNF